MMQHAPEHGIWITVEGLPRASPDPSEPEQTYIHAPARMIYDDINRLLDRFDETLDYSNDSTANCILDIQGAATYELQWVGKVTDVHKQNLINQFGGCDLMEDDRKSTWLNPQVSKATPTADYGFFSNNCGTALKYLAGIEKAKTWASYTCDLLGFQKVKGNLLTNIASTPTSNSYIHILSGTEPQEPQEAGTQVTSI